MRINAEKVFSKCVTIEIAIASLIVIFTALGYSNIVSLLFALSFALLFAFLGFTVQSFPFIAFLLSVLSFSHAVFYGLIEETAFSVSYFKRVIMFISMVLLLDFTVRYCENVSGKTLKLIQSFPIVAGAYLVFSFFFLGNAHIWAGGITLGFTNPNFTGMWLTHLIFYGILFVMQSKTHKANILFIPVIGLMLYLLVMTRTRSCFIAIIMFVLFLVIRLLRIRLRNWMCVLIAVFPIIFVFIYLKIIMSDTIQNTLSFLTSKGKPLSSRVFVWQTGLEIASKHPIFGNYIGLEGEIGYSHMHNTHLDVLCAYGIIPLVLFCYLLYMTLKRIISKVNSVYQYVAFASFASIIIMGTFEAAIVSGAMGMNLLTIGFIVLAISKPDEKIHIDSGKMV